MAWFSLGVCYGRLRPSTRICSQLGRCCYAWQFGNVVRLSECCAVAAAPAPPLTGLVAFRSVMGRDVGVRYQMMRNTLLLFDSFKSIAEPFPFLSLFIEEVQHSQGRHFHPSLSLFLSITAISNGSVESTLLSLLYCILSSTKSSFFVTLLIVEYHHTTFFASATG